MCPCPCHKNATQEINVKAKIPEGSEPEEGHALSYTTSPVNIRKGKNGQRAGKTTAQITITGDQRPR